MGAALRRLYPQKVEKCTSYLLTERRKKGSERHRKASGSPHQSNDAGTKYTASKPARIQSG